MPSENNNNHIMSIRFPRDLHAEIKEYIKDRDFGPSIVDWLRDYIRLKKTYGDQVELGMFEAVREKVLELRGGNPKGK